MTQKVHGHEVLRKLGDTNRSFTREGLQTEIFDQFGPDVRFHTCSEEGMTLDELLVFLKTRGKVVEQDGLLRSDLVDICSDE